MFCTCGCWMVIHTKICPCGFEHTWTYKFGWGWLCDNCPNWHKEVKTKRDSSLMLEQSVVAR